LGGPGSGAWEKHNRQIVGSCCEIDANHLSARGCLEPGQSSTIPLGICNSPDDGIDRGGGGGVVVLNLRAEVGWLFLSWRSLLDNPDAGAVHACTGRDRDAGEAKDGGFSDAHTVTEIIPVVRVPCRYGGSRPYFLCPVAGCGRRAIKLYLSRQQPGRRRFLCRHCSGLAYASQSEKSWQRAARRAHKLWRYLGLVTRITDDPRHAVLEKPKYLRPAKAPTYERLLEKTLQADLRATEAGTARLQWLAARIGNRPRFTLD